MNPPPVPVVGSRPSLEEALAQVRTILASSVLHNSESSRQLLEFLAARSNDHPGQHVKESEIAIEVFRREPALFDAQTDSVVRVQMARLRRKLREYYEGPGREDNVILDVPRGSYALVGNFRISAAPCAEVPETAPLGLPAEPADIIPASRRWMVPWRSVFIGMASLAAGIGLTLAASRMLETPVPPHVRQFWSQVLQKDAPSVVVFPNPRLAGTLAIQGLRYFDEERDTQDPSTENFSYSGAADVESAAVLMHLFDTMHLGLHLRSGALLSWDQAKESSLIFVGRPEQNPALHQLPRLPEFYFRFDKGIVNAHPRPGEQEVYPCSRRPYSHDYAIIALIPGLNRNMNTLILAGNTTYGSLAATEFVSNEASVVALLKELGVKPGQKLPYFEGLLEVRINKLTPVWSKLIAVRTFSPDQSVWTPSLPDER